MRKIAAVRRFRNFGLVVVAIASTLVGVAGPARSQSTGGTCAPINGNFASGLTGWTTDYQVIPAGGDMYPAGRLSVGPDFATAAGAWGTYLSGSFGVTNFGPAQSGNVVIVNTDTQAGATVLKRTVSGLTSGRRYSARFFVRKLVSPGETSLVVSVPPGPLGQSEVVVQLDTLPVNDWFAASVDFVASSNGAPELRFTEKSGVSFGGDFALSNVSVCEIQQGCGTLPIAACYAPQLRFHPSEQFFPMDPADWIVNNDLMWATNNCPDQEARYAGTGQKARRLSSRVDAADLTNGTYQHQEVNRLCNGAGKQYQTTDYTRPFSTNTANNGVSRPARNNGTVLGTAEGFYLNNAGVAPTGTVVGGGVVAPMFVEEHPPTGSTGRKISYWVFYGYDPKGPGIQDNIFQHEGDWEHITIEFTTNDIPTNVIYAAHGKDCASVQYAWPNPANGSPISLTAGTHPVVYVAQGTHASYPTGMIDPDFNRSLCGSDFTSSTDDTALTGSVSWDSWNNLQPVNNQCWFGFGGAWGETASTLGARPSDSTGPDGPPFNSKLTPSLISSGSCGNPLGTKTPPTQTSFSWGSTYSLGVTGATPGTPYQASLESIPLSVATGIVPSSGSTTISFNIPEGVSPGLHDVVVRDTSTGRDLFFGAINIVAPAGCTTEDPAVDVDGDYLANACDPDPTNGPKADYDNDGITNQLDNCATIPNPDQAATNGRSDGTACDRKAGFNIVQTYQQPTVLKSGKCSVCVLSPTATTTLNGQSSIVAANRSVGINGSLLVNGPSQLSTAGYGTNISVAGATTVNPARPLTTVKAPTVDPYQSLPLSYPQGSPSQGTKTVTGNVPTSVPGGTWTNVSVVNATATLNPGTYGQLTLTGTSSITFNPGVYLITGSLNITGNVQTNGNGVSFAFGCGQPASPRPCNTGEAGGTVTINTGSPITLAGPNSGLLFQADPNNTATFTLNNGKLTPPSNGTLYLPAAKLILNGLSTIDQPSNSPVIVGQLTLNGTSRVTTKSPTIG
jgi:hypothetical protein